MTKDMCKKICVSSCCVAATEMEHGSAGRTPTSVVNILLSNSPSDFIARSCFPICVSHSLATTKIEFVELTKRFEVASGANVPPECETMMTMASVKSSVFLEFVKPTDGTGKS